MLDRNIASRPSISQWLDQMRLDETPFLHREVFIPVDLAIRCTYESPDRQRLAQTQFETDTADALVLDEQGLMNKAYAFNVWRAVYPRVYESPPGGAGTL